jgi:dTMP kinase
MDELKMNLNKPQFITFEGGEGCGKSTQSKLLYEYLLSKNIKAIHTREIGGTVEAEQIRHLIIYSELKPMSELLLVMAARFEHINKVIIPALLDGTWVICDRFVDSTACYQSGESGLTMLDIYELHESLMKYKLDSSTIEPDPAFELQKFSSKGILPDITFFMDVPPSIGLNRATERGDANKFESKKLDFHSQVYERFKTAAALHEDRIISIDAAGKTIEEIQMFVRKCIFTK